MNNLTEYARKVSASKNLTEAHAAMHELINNFQFKDKQKVFNEFVKIKHSKQKLEKWAWDLVLVGFNEKVVK